MSSAFHGDGSFGVGSYRPLVSRAETRVPCLTTPRKTLKSSAPPGPRCYRTTHEFATCCFPTPVSICVVSMDERAMRNRWVPKGQHDEHAGPAGTQVSSARYLRSENDPESRSFNHRQHLVATLPAGKLRPLAPARWFQHGKRYFNRWSHVWNIPGFHRFGAGRLHQMCASQASRDPHSPPGMRIG